MIDKNLFIQDLKQVYTVLQELKVNEKMIKQLIDKYNLTEENLELTNEELEEIKPYIDSIKEYIIQNGTTTEIGGNVEIDGGLTINSTLGVLDDVNIKGELSLPSSSNLVFNDGSSLNKAKLVSEGVYNENSRDFILNNELELNKFYFIVLVCGDFSYKFSGIIFIDDLNYPPSCSINIMDNNDSNLIPCSVDYHTRYYDNGNPVKTLAIYSGDYSTVFQVTEEESNTCQVYELPFKL